MTDDAKMPTKAQAEALANLRAHGSALYYSPTGIMLRDSGARDRGFATYGLDGLTLTSIGRRALSLYESKHGPIKESE